MFRRREGDGPNLVARAACAFVTPALLLLLYVLGRPVRHAARAAPAQRMRLTGACAFADILVAVRQSQLHARSVARAPWCAQRRAAAPPRRCAELTLRVLQCRAASELQPGAAADAALDVVDVLATPPKPLNPSEYALSPELVQVCVPRGATAPPAC